MILNTENGCTLTRAGLESETMRELNIDELKEIAIKYDILKNLLINHFNCGCYVMNALDLKKILDSLDPPEVREPADEMPVPKNADWRGFDTV